MLDAVFRQSPVGLAFVDPRLRFLRVNDTLAQELGGAPAEELVGGASTTSSACSTTRDPSVPAGPAHAGGGHRGGGRRGRGAERWWQASFYPVVMGDALVAIGVVVVDVTAARRREERRRRELLAERRAAEEPRGSRR